MVRLPEPRAPGPRGVRPLSDARAVRRLRGAFGRALREAQHRRAQLFLELFAGSGRVASCIRRRGYGALSFEINLGDEFDVSRPATLRLIGGWIRSHCVCGVWLGTPCASWSRARRGIPGSPGGPLRSEAHITGLVCLPPADQTKVRLGNRTAEASFSCAFQTKFRLRWRTRSPACCGVSLPSLVLCSTPRHACFTSTCARLALGGARPRLSLRGTVFPLAPPRDVAGTEECAHTVGSVTSF